MAYPLGNPGFPPLGFPYFLCLQLFPGDVYRVFFYMNPVRHNYFPLYKDVLTLKLRIIAIVGYFITKGNY